MSQLLKIIKYKISVCFMFSDPTYLLPYHKHFNNKPSLPNSAAQCAGVVPSFMGKFTSASRSIINLRSESTFPSEANLCMGELGKSVVDDDVSFDLDLSGDFTNTDDFDSGLLPTAEGESTLDDGKLGNGDDDPLAEDEYNISESENFLDDSKSSDNEVPNDDFADMVEVETLLEN